jgi:hypothetical protein
MIEAGKKRQTNLIKLDTLEKKMKKWLLAIMILLSSIVFCVFSFAGQDTQGKTEVPWEKVNLNLGAFISTIDSSVGLGGNNIGIDIDLEDATGLDTSISAFRVDASWRFTDNLRHRFDLTWFDLNRDSTRVLQKDIEIGDKVFPANATINSTLDISMFKGAYSYSFFQDDRFDLAASVGLFVIPIKYAFNSTGITQVTEGDSITAPLPVVGLRGDFAITPKLFFKTNLDFFYLEFDNYKGSIIDVKIALEYNFFKNVGFGLGYEHFQTDVEAENSTSVPGVDFNGNIMFNYSGVQLYTKIYF